MFVRLSVTARTFPNFICLSYLLRAWKVSADLNDLPHILSSYPQS